MTTRFILSLAVFNEMVAGVFLLLRCLIVIDDVWTVAAWDAIVSRLPDNMCNSRIIVTTRIETVAKACCSDVGGGYLYPIKPLNFEDSKKLFLSRAFGSKDACCPQELEDEMGTILRKCGGLPLAIVSIASLLTSYGSKDMWERVCRSIGSHMESHPTLEGMRQILTLSYNHLPHHLKGCMMYLSIFPEDYVINIGRLMHRWIAEGLVEEKRGLTSLEVAEAYLDELMNRSMVDAVTSTRQDQRALECRVHDMMLEVMVSKSLEANFASLLGRQYEGIAYDRIRRLSIHGGEHGSMAAGQMNMQHARSLSTFNLEGHKMLDRLGEFGLLRVLDLQDCKGLQNKHMRDVCRMYLLRYLSLRNTHITLLPPKVGELEHLQTLAAMHTGLEGLPDTVTKLEKLERLLFTNRNDYRVWWLPSQGLPKMKALHELVRIGIKNVQVAREIGELQQMRVICIYIDSDDDALGELSLSLSKLYSLRWLDMKQDRPGKTLNFLNRLQSPPRLLQFLKLQGNMNALPDWFGSLAHLVEIDISRAFLADCQENLFGVLCRAPNLKSIILQLDFYKGEKLVARTVHNFPALTSLTVTLADEFPKVFQVETGSMTKLETLSLEFGGTKGKRIVGTQHLTNIKEVHLSGKKDSSALNSALNSALEELKKESASRSRSNQFQFTIGVSHW